MANSFREHDSTLTKRYYAPLMSSFEIPETVINATALQIHSKTNKDYKIPVVGVPENLETPQIFEIMPFEQIDKHDFMFYARAFRLFWYQRPLPEIVKFWRERWLLPRAARDNSYLAFDSRAWRTILNLDRP